MTDPLSIAASIAGLLSLAGPILAEGYAYIASVRDSPNALKQLLSEISRLEAVLGQIDELASESATNNSIVQTQCARQRISEVITPDTVKTASDLLKSVHASIKMCERTPGQSAKNVGRAIVWPFKEREVKEKLDRFKGLIYIFELALSIESSHLLRNVNKRTSAIMDEQQDAKRQKLILDNEFRDRQQGLVRDVHETLSITKMTHMAVAGNSESVMKLDMEARRERVHKLLEMLSPLDPPKRHQDLQTKRYKGSVLWLLEHEGFRVWQDSSIPTENTSNRILQCYGIPGAGKTIISSMVIDHLVSHYGEQRVAYIYCDYRDKTNQNLLNILGSILKQHLAVTTNIPEEVAGLLESLQKRGKRVMISDVSQMLKFVLPQLDASHFLCIDALDELEPMARLEFLKALQTEFGSTRIFLTGRPHITSDVSRILQINPVNAIQITPNSNEVRAYLSHQIELDWELNPGDMNEQLKEEILNGILTKAQGMFLLPALHISMVLVQPTMAKRRKALTTLPSQLDDAYACMVDRIRSSSALSDLGMRVLMWLHLATQPLRVDEIQHVLAVEPGDIALDEEAIPAQKRLLDCCLGLVLVDEETSTIRLVHYTLEEYFRTHSSSIFPHGYTTAAETCLTYLNFGELSAECKTETDMRERLQRFPFLKYASCNWGHYATLAQGRNDGDTERLAALAMKVLLSKNKQSPHIAFPILYSYIQDPRMGQVSWYHHTSSLQFLGVHAAAYFGLESYMSVLGNDQGWNVRAADGKIPLSFAALAGREAVVRLLVERADIDVNTKDDDARTPLSLAVEGGHEAVVRLLVGQADVDINTKHWCGDTPLSLAAQQGYEAVVGLLVKRADVDVNAKNAYGNTPLSLSAQRGYEAVVRLLIERADADVNAKDNNGNTPLLLATERGYEAVVRLLVEQVDVDVNAKDKNGSTPLSLAAEGGHDAVVRLLVERADVDINAKDNYDRTPLSWAAQRGHEAAVRLLVERTDIDVMAKDEYGKIPLSLAAQWGHEAVVRLLVEWPDVDVNAKDNSGYTPLSWAAEGGYEAVVRLLVERTDVDINAKDKSGCIPLSLAARRGHEAIVWLFIERADVDVNAKDNYGNTPLSLAAERGHEAIVQLLAERADVDINAKDNFGDTPLSLAAKRGHEAIVRLLVDRVDVDVSAKNEYGSTPLSLAAQRGYEPIVRLLVEREDADVKSRDTAVEMASTRAGAAGDN